MSARTSEWDPAHYESTYSFVWNLGADLVGILNPQPAERILDIGCGTGHLTARIAESGAVTHGIDKSPAMIAQARQNFPRLSFELVDAQRFHAKQLFDAAFSNAALHWMLDAEATAQAIARSLKPGARFVGEMAGRGNLAAVLSALQTDTRNFYPSVSEYSAILENQGFEVTSIGLFDRPTPLENGIADWISMFRPDNRRPLDEVEAELKPKLFHDGRWIVDYRRLRFTAAKLS